MEQLNLALCLKKQQVHKFMQHLLKHSYVVLHMETTNIHERCLQTEKDINREKASKERRTADTEVHSKCNLCANKCTVHKYGDIMSWTD